MKDQKGTNYAGCFNLAGTRRRDVATVFLCESRSRYGTCFTYALRNAIGYENTIHMVYMMALYTNSYGSDGNGGLMRVHSHSTRAIYAPFIYAYARLNDTNLRTGNTSTYIL